MFQIPYNHMCIGTCSQCGGPVIVAQAYLSTVPPTPYCMKCGALPASGFGPIIPMAPNPQQTFIFSKPPGAYVQADTVSFSGDLSLGQAVQVDPNNWRAPDFSGAEIKQAAALKANLGIPQPLHEIAAAVRAGLYQEELSHARARQAGRDQNQVPDDPLRSDA